MSKYKLELTLKQHTPLIHFQHDQDGATLRATELKPKLDRFILTKLGNGNYEHGVDIARQNGWLVGNGDHPALDYKVRIEAPKNISYYLPLARKLNTGQYPNRETNLKGKFSFTFNYIHNSPFFANEDKFKWNGNWIDLDKSKLDEVRFAVYTNENINGEIKSFNPKEINGKTLLETIEENLPDFFLSTNFGTRQNKGFGSFTVRTINGEKTKFIEQEDLEKVFDYVYKLKGNFKDITSIFSTIDKQYKNLKNNPAQNESKIRDYFKSRGITWEKPAVTRKLIFDENVNPSNYRYVRTLLGLAELHDYQQFDKKIKISHNAQSVDQKIERFPSPLIYKVFYGNIYLCVPKQTYLEEILDEEFWFYRTPTLENARPEDRLSLRVPDKFDIIDFLNESLGH